MTTKAWFLIPLLCLNATQGRADENKLFSRAYVYRVGRDVSTLPGTVFHWSQKNWLLAGGVVGLTAAVERIDGETREDFGSKQTHGKHDAFSKAVKPFGDYRYLAPIIAGTWLGGMATGSPILSKIAADGLEANLVATALVTPTLALAAGRNRPYQESSPLDFSPFHSGRSSFPSGHTTAAFATAAVIDANLRAKFGYWQTPVVYSVATAVGLSRVYDQKHHPSDVVMGAAVGSAIGYWIARRPRNQDAAFSFEIEPTAAKVKFRFGGNSK